MPACLGYDAEAQTQSVGRFWVRHLFNAGRACVVDLKVMSASLPRLPPEDPIFLLSDVGSSLPEAFTSGLSTLQAPLFAFDNLVKESTGIHPTEYTPIMHTVCAAADTLLLNSYSPLSRILKETAEQSADTNNRKAPSTLYWM